MTIASRQSEVGSGRRARPIVTAPVDAVPPTDIDESKLSTELLAHTSSETPHCSGFYTEQKDLSK